VTSLVELAEKYRPAAWRALLGSTYPLALGVGFALLVQIVIAPAVGPYISRSLIDIGINVVLAVSLNLVNGFCGQFSIGHAAFMAVGGYTAAAITYYGSLSLWGSPAVHGAFLGAGDQLYLGALLAGGVVAAAAGFLVGLPSLRLRGDYLAIVTLGFGEILRVMLTRTDDVLFTQAEVQSASLLDLATRLGGPLGFTGVPFYTTLFWVYVFVTVTLLVAHRLKVSSSGRAFLSVRENEIAAEAVGVNTTRVKVNAFVISAALAGIAGGLFAHEVGTTINAKELGFQKSFDVVIMVVLGGSGSISGSVLAAILLTALPEALRGFSEYRLPVYAALLILMMIARPQGLLGVHELWEWPPVKRLWRRSR
jgi:branched-chain amino acid transport system permease protein